MGTIPFVRGSVAIEPPTNGIVPMVTLPASSVGDCNQDNMCKAYVVYVGWDLIWGKPIIMIMSWCFPVLSCVSIQCNSCVVSLSFAGFVLMVAFMVYLALFVNQSVHVLLRLVLYRFHIYSSISTDFVMQYLTLSVR